MMERVETILPRMGTQSQCAHVLFRGDKAFRKLVTCKDCEDASQQGINDCNRCVAAFQREEEVMRVCINGAW